MSYADRFAAVFKTAGKDVPVTVLPGIDHISLTLDPVAVQAAIAAVESMDHEKPNQTIAANREPSLGPDFHAHESQSKFARWLILVSLDAEPDALSYAIGLRRTGSR